MGHRANPLQRLLQKRDADSVQPVALRAALGVFVVRFLERTGVELHASLRVENANPRLVPADGSKEGSDVGERRFAIALHHGYEETSLPLHAVDLRLFQMTLVDVDDENPGHRQEDEQQVEQHQADGDPRQKTRRGAHQLPPAASG